jgi:uncharacterized protein YyaL (SSP411 family)
MGDPRDAVAGGGYYSTLDADSEGHEGKFYVWTPGQVRGAVAATNGRLPKRSSGSIARRTSKATPGTGDCDAGCGRGGALSLSEPCLPSSSTAHATSCSPHAKRASVRAVTRKILTSWNALMIEGMAHAARVFGRDDWLDSARRALDFAQDDVGSGGEATAATHKDGKTHLNAYLDDYAYLVKAIVAVLQAEFRSADLAFAREVADV